MQKHEKGELMVGGNYPASHHIPESKLKPEPPSLEAIQQRLAAIKTKLDALKQP